MSLARQQAALAVDALCSLVGRRKVVRAARFALNRARLDLPNQPAINGEYALQRWLLSAIPPSRKLTVLDVGANVGEWSKAILNQADHTGHSKNLNLHAFEPATITCTLLRERLPDFVRVNKVAMSDRNGQRELYLVGPGAGTNSLHTAASGVSSQMQTELVSTTTIDSYLRDQAISRVDLLKIDTEGHDFSVLRGAEQSFRAKIISVAQFEYNHRWVQARHFLKDVFDLLEPLSYRIGKLTPRGIELYSGWDPELEGFTEGNYVACTHDMVELLPRITWWKSGT